MEVKLGKEAFAVVKTWPKNAKSKIVNDLIINHFEKINAIEDEILKLKQRCYYCPNTTNIKEYGYIAICSKCLNQKGGPSFLLDNEQITNPNLDTFIKNSKKPQA